MGYYMDQRDCNFFIKKENIQKAWDALIELFKIEKKSIHDSSGWHYSWIDTVSVLKAKSFEDAMSEARWDVEYNSNGDIDCIRFNGEKYGGDEDTILGSIAQYVEDGSYIEMVGEDNNMWRWTFNNGCVDEIYPTIIWE